MARKASLLVRLSSSPSTSSSQLPAWASMTKWTIMAHLPAKSSLNGVSSLVNKCQLFMEMRAVNRRFKRPSIRSIEFGNLMTECNYGLCGGLKRNISSDIVIISYPVLMCLENNPSQFWKHRSSSTTFSPYPAPTFITYYTALGLTLTLNPTGLKLNHPS